ncbi:MAG: zinc ribbon domain-containing protein [Dehalococcoidales bacterium]|nr:zinc ribbon domain-containing protein [Dehalococcoidales bacterium]
MPIYEYVCDKCQNRFDLRLSFEQANSTALCPRCHAEARRTITSFSAKTGSYLQVSAAPFRKEIENP